MTIIIYSIFYIVLFLSSLNLLLLCVSTSIYLHANSLDLYKYKIHNKLFTAIVIVLYISIFIILFYVWRIYNIGNYLDLKIFYSNTITIWKTFITPLSFLQKTFIIIYSIIIIFLFLIVISFLIKKALLEIYKLYIYISEKPVSSSTWTLRRKIEYSYTRCRNSDIISYIVHCILETLLKKYKNKEKYPENYEYFGSNIINILIYNDRYKLFVRFSPLLFILYDCIFNDFVIINFYYYMLIYVPLMLNRRITTCITETNSGFARILWHLYYNKDKNIYFVASKEQKEIIDILLKANLGYVYEFLLTMVEFYLERSITYTLWDQKENIYVNNDCNFLRIKNNKIYEVIEDEEGNILYKETEEWIFL